jgi:2-succinyl-6-hydroxy-2,4-cyclohexadiene-1-carboxylate synthase
MTRLTLPDGVGMNVEVSGAGQPLVLLHGFTGSAPNWQAVAEQLEKHYKIVRVDLLGHGQSDSPSDPARYGMEACVADLAFVFKTLDLHEIALLGYSMGGRVALSFALEHPELLRALILESASPGLAEAQEREARIQSDEALAAKIEREGLTTFVDYWECLPVFATQANLPEDVRAGIRDGRLRNNPVGLAGSLRGMGTGDQPENWSRLGLINMPTLILAGSLDSKFAGIAKSMGDVIPTARTKIVAGAGHTIHLEQSAEFIWRVTDFLNSERN